MENSSLLQRHRLRYQPTLPTLLQDIHSLVSVSKELPIDHTLSEIFPCTYSLPALSFKSGDQSSDLPPLKVGVVLSGGQAPGGHNVITGVFDALKKINPISQLIGFLDGPNGIIKNAFVELTAEKIAPYRNQGGFDMIGAGRTKIETPEQFESAGQTLQKHALDGLIIIGGDDSNTNAAFLAEYCKQKKLATRIIGVPKTIDGDLKNSYIETSFGFDTASKIYSEIIGNLAKDALSAKKYYFFVKMMGRSASHLTLECALQTHINMALIGEEISEQNHTLNEVVQQITDLICERAERNKHYGTILIPEGLLEFIPECQNLFKELNRFLAENQELAKEIDPQSRVEYMPILEQHLSHVTFNCFSKFPSDIQKQLLLDRDPHGNIQLSKIETERLLIHLVDKELNIRQQEGRYKGQFNPQPLFCGYEGRAGFPSNFDCQYCYALGYLAALLILHNASGYMCCINNLTSPVEEWKCGGVPIVSMLHFEVRKNKKQVVIQKALVDLQGAAFAAFKQKRKGWSLNDLYCTPGPIQFDGPKEITDTPSITLLLENHCMKLSN